MTDSTLQRVWDSREAISRRCDYDSRKLIHFYRARQKNNGRTKGSKRQSKDHSRTVDRSSSWLHRALSIRAIWGYHSGEGSCSSTKRRTIIRL